MSQSSMFLSENLQHSAELKYKKILADQPRFPWCVFADGEELVVHGFFPDGHVKDQKKPAVIFFYGGMWQISTPLEMVPWCMHLAARGIVALLPAYRTRSGYDVSPQDIMNDAKELWKWVRDNADELGLDVTKIAVVGCDAGGLMALHLAMPPMIKQRWYQKAVPSDEAPAAVAVFRGVVDLSIPNVGIMTEELSSQQIAVLDPSNRLRKNLPPLFCAHGDRDRLLPNKCSQIFSKAWQKKGNISVYEEVHTGDHAFYLFNAHADLFEYTLRDWFSFMIEIGVWDESVQEAGWGLA